MKFEDFFHRAQHHYRKGHRIRVKFYRILTKIVFQCDIPPSSNIAETAYFCHNAFGVVINPAAVIQDGVVMQHSVTIGELEVGRAPIIEEGVSIGARACILGDITVGAGSKIGAGAVVISDVPPGSTVVGVPARVVRKG